MAERHLLPVLRMARAKINRKAHAIALGGERGTLLCTYVGGENPSRITGARVSERNIVLQVHILGGKWQEPTRVWVHYAGVDFVLYEEEKNGTSPLALLP